MVLPARLLPCSRLLLFGSEFFYMYIYIRIFVVAAAAAVRGTNPASAMGTDRPSTDPCARVCVLLSDIERTRTSVLSCLRSTRVEVLLPSSFAAFLLVWDYYFLLRLRG